jgi:hypothetical protein
MTQNGIAATMCRTTGTGEPVNLAASGTSCGPPASWVILNEPETIGMSVRRINPVGMSQVPREGRSCVDVIAMGRNLWAGVETQHHHMW